MIHFQYAILQRENQRRIDFQNTIYIELWLMFKILLLLFARTTILIGGRLGHSAIFFTGGMPLKEIKTKPEGGKPKLLDKAAKAPKTAM